MPLKWDDERYVRLYTRDTSTWLRLTWEGRFVLMALLRKLDRSGNLDLGDEGQEGMESLAALLQMPVEIAAVGLPQLLRRGAVVQPGTVLSMPNFRAAQEAKQSAMARQRALRERAAATRESATREQIATKGVTS